MGRGGFAHPAFCGRTRRRCLGSVAREVPIRQSGLDHTVRIIVS
jgi:hypothetical protein